MSSIILNDDTSHYQHGIPGIPTDGKVVVLKNSKFNSEVYLVGTVHISKQSAETVKKVINYVRPKAVGIELSEEHAKDVMNSETEDVSLFEMLCDNMRAPWDLPMKIDMFAQDFWDYQFRAKGIHPGLEFKVAMEEASRMRARCYLIDEDDDVIDEKLSKVFSWLLLWKYWKFVLAGVKSVLADVFKARKARNYSLSKIIEGATESTRASIHEGNTGEKKHYPEYFKALTDDRDKFMFEKIRTIQRKKVVVVVGIAHMDGIELLWKQAEEDMLQKKKNAEEGDNKRPLSSKKRENNKRRHRRKQW